MKKLLGICSLMLLVGCNSNDTSKDRKRTENVSADSKRPNIVVILTDQERYPTHWPEGWAKEHLKATELLKKNGLFFTHAYTAACECTPSRAVIYSGEHFPTNQVPITPPSGAGLPSGKQLMDIGTLLKTHAGYDVVWKGKWHLSPPLKGGHDWTEKDIANVESRYQIYRWNPPDAGTAITEHIKQADGTTYDGLKTLGGGWANNDGRFLEGMTPGDTKQLPGFGESILEYIAEVGKVPADERKPFCLFISFVNPHDVWVYPKHWDSAGYNKEEFADVGISLPENYDDDLTTKPSVQLKARTAFNDKSPLKNTKEEKEYVNFYAYLTELVDQKVGAVLDALDKAGLTNETIIIKTADHGELGLSHGMREKSYTVYEEMIHIPFIVSNPKLYPEAKTTDAFYCHLDLLPTIAELAKVPNFNQYGKGTSIVPVINDPTASVQDSILFTFDDVFFLPVDVPGGHIRAIREGDWTYGVYYSKDGSHFEYEMYNSQEDPSQLKNLLYKNITPEIKKEANRLHLKLKQKIDQSNALPKDFPWPAKAFSE